MKSLLGLAVQLLAEAGSRCGTSTSRDIKTVTVRVEHEGLSFLTITLPDFAKQFDHCLDQGLVSSDDFHGFHRKGRALPAFLSGLLRMVFDSRTGVLLPSPSVVAIREIRQFTRLFSKYGDTCTPERDRAALRAYVECENELQAATLSDSDLADLERISAVAWGTMLSGIDRKISQGDYLPRHGAGATADRLRGNAKYGQKVWPARSERSFPSWAFLSPSYSLSSLRRLDRVQLIEPGDELPVKVITVPKTQRTPRIIAEEPTCMQYMQQGLLEMFQEAFRSDPLAASLIDFSSQKPNQRLAKEGSLTGSLATLDLSEASDRVHYRLVKAVFGRHRLLREALDDCRSARADVPGYGVLPLAKFASMGSAATFPVESIVFATIVLLGIERSSGRRLRPRDIMSLKGRVRVYGDDIIVPVQYVPSVIELLEALGLKVNQHKSFWNGKFRESCGEDYYDGHNVSCVKFRQPFPRSRHDSREVIALVSFRNQLFQRGYVDTVAYLDRRIERVIPFPEVDSLDSPLLGKLTYSPAKVGRFNPTLFRAEARGMVVHNTLPVSRLSGVDALMKHFLKRSEDPYEEGHLDRDRKSVV